MKKCNYILIITLGLFFATSYLLNAQQLTDENTLIINQYFQLNNQQTAKLNNPNLATSSKFNQFNNLVNLNQVGNDNQITIQQKGNDSQTINQIGNKNNYNFINYFNSTPSNFNIIQQGNSNNLQIFGENSIINNISIIQKSDFNTLIIKNY
jgi:hypothetical protein